MQQVKVDMVGAKPRQAALAGSNCTLAGRVIWRDFAHKEDFVASAFDRLGDQLLRTTVAIHFCCVDERDTKIEAKAKRRDLFRAHSLTFPEIPSSQSKG